MKNRFIGTGLLTLVVLLMMTVGDALGQDGKKVLVTASGPGDPRSIDPQQAFDTKDWDLENILFPALTTLNPETKTIVPGLAASWDVSADGKVYTFHLVENVPWVRYNAETDAVEQLMDDSGSPRTVTAQDVVYGWRRALDPTVGSPAAFMLAPLIVGGQEFNAGTGSADDLGIQALDDFTFEVTTPEAVDRQSLADNVFKGGRIPARWYTPPSVAFAPTLDDNPDLGIAFDATTAQAELALGLTDLGLSSADDLPSITVVFGNTELNNSVAQALQIMWEGTLNITVTLNPLDTTTYWSTMAEDAGQIHAAGWCPDYNDANNYTRDVMYSTGIYNYGRWNSSAFDTLVEQARISTDNAERRDLYKQAEQLMVVDEAAVMPLVWESIPTLTKPGVTRTFAPNNVQEYWKWDINK